jgi:undecaprenyl-diphosphatase
VRGFLRTLRTRKLETPDERLAWLLIVATIPAGLTGLALEHALRTLFAKPLAAAIFLTINGLILLAGERVRRRAAVRALVAEHPTGERGEGWAAVSTRSTSRRPESSAWRRWAPVRASSRSGITMVAGLVRGLDHGARPASRSCSRRPSSSRRASPKLPDLTGPLGNGIRGRVLAGSIAAGLAAFAAVRFLMRFFEGAQPHAVRDLPPHRRRHLDHPFA